MSKSPKKPVRDANIALSILEISLRMEEERCRDIGVLRKA